MTKGVQKLCLWTGPKAMFAGRKKHTLSKKRTQKGTSLGVFFGLRQNMARN
jgi:hypothetical protein